jgi:homoserine/homoserine lactone efflux protein
LTWSTWIAYFIACWAISLSPGPGALAAMTSGVNHGFRRGYFTTFGLILGGGTQLVLIVVGLGALIAASNLAFTVLKYAGAAYLVWLGIQQWRASDAPILADTTGASAVRTRRELVLRGWVVNALNPKGTVFMLAVVPQFLDLAKPMLLQYVEISATLAFTDLVVMAGYTALASRVLRSLREAHHVRWMNRTFGTLFIAAGTLLATFKRAHA